MSDACLFSEEELQRCLLRPAECDTKLKRSTAIDFVTVIVVTSRLGSWVFRV